MGNRLSKKSEKVTAVMIDEYSKIVVMGAGAVGCFFGGMLARAGRDVTLIARQHHVDAISQHGLYMDCMSFQEYVPVKATTDIAAIADADIVLFCVKSLDTKKTIETIGPYLKKTAVILSLQNGVDNCNMIKDEVSNHVYPAVVYVATGMAGSGRLKHFGRGELRVGDLGYPHMDKNSSNDELKNLSEMFFVASIPCGVSLDVKKELWCKFLVNCCYNGISAIGQIQYGKMYKEPYIRDLINQITQEFLSVALKEGVLITREEAAILNEQIATSMAGQTSSTAQDLSRKKPTEIDYLNGLIVKKGEEYGINVSANQSIYSLVKMMELSY